MLYTHPGDVSLVGLTARDGGGVETGTIAGPAMNTERLVWRGYTNTEKSLAANYAPGDVVAFQRPYKRFGVEKGDELRVAGIDRKAGIVNLTGKDGDTVAWEPGRLAARPAESKSMASTSSSCVGATACAGPGTTPRMGWSTAARPR